MNFIFPLLIFIGFLLFAISLILAVRRYFFLQSALTTQGVITHVDITSSNRTSEYGPSSKTLFKPTVKFQTKGGQVFENTARVATNKQWEVGQSVVVNYEEGDPSKFVLGERSGCGVWLPFAIVGAVGVFFMLIGLMMTFLF